MPRLPSAPRHRSILRVAAVALALLAGFAVVTHSSSDGHERDRLAEAVRRGADRLVALQGEDGAWPRGLSGSTDVASAGRAGRALLVAHQVTRDPRHLRAALRAARAIFADLHGAGVMSTSNLLFIAELGRFRGEPALLQVADDAWRTAHPDESPDAAADAARQLMSSPNPTSWPDGAWRNYLLVRASEEADLARTLGHASWSDAYLVEAAGSWAPKHDHEFWASAAGSLLAELSRSSDPRVRRLELAERGLLESNQVLRGIAWNDTPYDTYVYASETAAALAGLIRNDRSVRPGTPAFEGLEFLAARQSDEGGWGSVLSLVDDVAEHGSDELSSADEAAAETPDLDAQVVRTLALSLAG